MTSRRGADRLAAIVASFAWCGFFPVAPATFTSAVAALGLAWIYPLGSWFASAVFVGAVFFVGVWACGRVERFWGHDPGAAVIDEVCGMCVTLVAAPITPATLCIGFLFFRVFDILKVPPGRTAERLPGGWGVMLDDVVAGVYAALALRLVLVFWPEPRLQTWHAIPLVVAVAAGIAFRKPLLRRYAKPHVRARSEDGESA